MKDFVVDVFMCGFISIFINNKVKEINISL